jgi:hypothetical protein
MPRAFRIAYPAAAVLASLGVVAFSGLRVRQERQQLAYEAKPTAKPTPHGSPNGIYEFDRKDESFSVWAVLKNDPVFRSYLACQFLAGVSNMMSEPVFVALVADATEPLGTHPRRRPGHLAGVHRFDSADDDRADHAGDDRPTALGSLLDRLHVVRYRVRHTWVWPLSQIICFAGGYMVMFEAGLVWGLVVLGVGRFVLGIARGGGMIAWMLGHNDFASRRMTSCTWVSTSR